MSFRPREIDPFLLAQAPSDASRAGALLPVRPLEADIEHGAERRGDRQGAGVAVA
jgi:hypothetical protein